MYVPFYSGWNFISIPLALAQGHDTGDIFSGIDTQGRSTWKYNASSVLWEMVMKDTRLEQTEGLWIYSAQFTQFGLYFEKQQGTVNKTLYKGWNGWGIPGSQDKSARDALSPILNSWSYAIGFNGASQEYDIAIINGGSGDRSDLRHMFPARGYWVFLNENATFQASPPFY